MQNAQENAEKYVCEACDFNCRKLSNWNIHISTTKHLHRTKIPELEQPKSNNKSYKCKHCDKEYKARNSLWYHENKCNINTTLNQEEQESVKKSSEPNNNELVAYLMNENKELKHMIIEVCKNINTTNNSNNNVNSHNKTFNLNLFLHEECKDAMDLSEFLESIKIQLADVMSVGELGYVNGISKLIIQNLKALDVTKRPVHCTDEKREVIYIKEAGVWTKDEDNSKLRRLIKTVSNRNFRHTRLYKEKYPDCRNPESKYSDIYVKLVLEATGGGSKYNDYDSENKIMSMIAKEMTIDKRRFS
jgi:hypothetical protein